jgi:hypothetical protein
MNELLRVLPLCRSMAIPPKLLCNEKANDLVRDGFPHRVSYTGTSTE